MKGCVFAPYFCTDEMGAPHFGSIHKVFGASNFSKLLLHLPVQQRYDAAVSVLYEAEARLQDPVHGCGLHIFALQNQVEILKRKLAVLYGQLEACRSVAGDLPHQYISGKQSHISSSISNSGSFYERQSFPLGDLQSITSENVAFYNYRQEGREDESSYCFPCSNGDSSTSAYSAQSTVEQTYVFQDAESLSEQKHPKSDNGDLQDLVSAILR